MSKIGINLLFIKPKLSGGSETYALKLLKEISQLDKDNEYILYINKDCENIKFHVGENFTKRVLNFKPSSVYLRYFWEQFVLPFYVFIDKIDLLHSLGYVTPLLTTSKKVVSILDINYKGHGNNMGSSKRILLGTMVNLSAFFSNKIITISEFSKQQITKYTKTRANKISVTLLSGSSDVIQINTIEKELILKKYNINTEYIIAFGSPSPHKNIVRLVESVEGIIKNRPDLKLVLVGHQQRDEDLLNCIQKLQLADEILFTGFVPDEDIQPLLTCAKVFVFPSLYEGFGIPLLDAQACGVPVISSNAGSLPEVGGSDVFYFNPEDVIEISEVISRALELSDTGEISDNVKNGLTNREKFSWAKTAEQTLKVYSELLN